MYSIGRSDTELSGILSAAAGVVADPPPPTQDEVAALVHEVQEKGDAARGERVFRRSDLSCMRCHSVSRAGGQVGPELSAIGGSSPVDYVVNSILNPSLAVKEQFVTRIFGTTDGKLLTGIVIDATSRRVSAMPKARRSRWLSPISKTKPKGVDDAHRPTSRRRCSTVGSFRAGQARAVR